MNFLFRIGYDKPPSLNACMYDYQLPERLNMLKRQRPATPPPASLDSSPYFPGRPFRPLPQRASDAASLSERSKRRRVLDSTPTGPCDSWKEGSDGKDDWVGDDDAGSPCPSATCRTGMDYKRPNGLLHELHVLHQHRLMFSPSDYPNSTYGVLPPPIYAHPTVHGNVDAASFLPQSSPGKSPVPQSSLTSAPHGQMRQPHPGQAVLHEAESVWEHYEGTNRSSPFPCVCALR